jgi:hypothetical protein
MRLVSGVLVAVLVCGCGSGSNNAVARNVLLALTVGTTAVAVGAAVKGRSVQNDLQRDLDAGKLTGMQFAERDNSGARWNRVSRAAAFTTGVFVLGLGIVWEMGQANRIQNGPREWTPADDPRPIIPLQSQAAR